MRLSDDYMGHVNDVTDGRIGAPSVFVIYERGKDLRFIVREL